MLFEENLSAEKKSMAESLDQQESWSWLEAQGDAGRSPALLLLGQVGEEVWGVEVRVPVPVLIASEIIK